MVKVGLIYAERFGPGVLEVSGSIGTGISEKVKAYFSQVVSSAGNVTLEPDFWQAESALTYYFGGTYFRIYGRFRNFDASDVEYLVIPAQSLVVPVRQPDTEEWVLGLSVGFHF